MAAVSASLTRISAVGIPSTPRWTSFASLRQITHKLMPSLAVGLPGVSLNLPGIFDDIWDSVLRAVPKNKVSHSKKRSRQMAGKALKDVNHLCKCPGCGELKRTHRICQTCLEQMRRIWRESYTSDRPF